MQMVGRAHWSGPCVQKSLGFVPAAAGSRLSKNNGGHATELWDTNTGDILEPPARNVDPDQDAHSERQLSIYLLLLQRDRPPSPLLEMKM